MRTDRHRRLLAARLREVTSPGGRLRILLLTLGVAAGMGAVAAAVTIGQGSRALFAGLERAVHEPERLELEPTSGRFDPAILDSLQLHLAGAVLCPIMEVEGRIPALDARSVRILGLDLVGDPRVPLLAGRLDGEALRRVVAPTVYVPRRLLEDGRLEAGHALELHVRDRAELFVVAPFPLSDELTARSSGAVVAIDVAHFQAAFRPEGGLDRVAVVGDASSGRLHDALARHLPSGARILVLGSGSRLAVEWVELWSRVASLLVSVGFLLGVVIVYLAVTAAYARVRTATAPLVGTGTSALAVTIAEVGEVVAITVIASALGAFNGWLVAEGIGTWVIGLGPWEAVTPIAGGPPPVWPLVAALGMGVGTPTVLALVNRPAEGGHEVLIEIPRAPAAVAGILFVLASMLTIPGAGPGRLALAYAAALLVCIGIGLLGRPFLAAAGALIRRAGARVWPIGARVIAAQLLERPTPLAVSLAFVTFTTATTIAMWSVAGHLEAINDAWMERTFGRDVRVEAAAANTGERGVTADLAARLLTRPEVAAVEMERRVAATLGGGTLPLVLVAPARIAALTVAGAAPTERIEEAATASPPVVPIFMPVATARAHALAPGAPTWIDTETGSWRCIVAGTYRPELGAPATTLADATGALGRLTRGDALDALDVRLRPDVAPRAGRDAIAEAVGPKVPLRVRPLDLARPHVERAFEIAQRTVMLLLAVLSVLTGIAFLSLAGGALVDVPPAWRVMAALGIPRDRIAASAAMGRAALAFTALLAGGVAGAVSAGAITGAVGEPALPVPVLASAAVSVWAASFAAWALATVLIVIVSRSRRFARAIEEAA